MTTTTAALVTITCTCTACGGKSATAPAGLVTGTPKQVRNLTHSYVQGAHAPAGGIYRVMADRAGVVAA